MKYESCVRNLTKKRAFCQEKNDPGGNKVKGTY